MIQKPKQTLLLLDGNALLHRAWHALPPLTTKAGLVVNAVYGFAMVVEKMLKEIHPDFMAVAWDVKGKTFRHKLYENYKGTRKEKEQELYDQIPLVQELLEAYGIQSLSKEGYEADDVIGTLCKKMKQKKDLKTLVVSGDLDLLQLVDDQTSVLFFQKGISQTISYDSAAVVERFSFTPEKLVEYKALRGDPSDNIPGIKGIGEKTAGELVKTYGTLEKIFQALEKKELPESIAQKLYGQKDLAFASRELVTIVKNIPLSFSLSKTSCCHPDRKRLVELFQTWEFKTLLKKYEYEPEQEEPRQKRTDVSLSAVVRDIQTLREQIQVFQKKTVGFFILEKQADLFGSSLSLIGLSDGKTTILVPEPEKTHLQEIVSFLSQTQRVVVHDAKRVLHICAKQDIFFSPTELGSWFDLMIASYLLSSSSRLQDLPSIISTVLHLKIPAFMETGFSEKEYQKMGFVLSLFPKLAQEMETMFQKEGVEKVFSEIEMPLVHVLFSMERAGICLDSDFLKTLFKEFKKILQKHTKEIYKQAGETFNINSPVQLALVLFETLGLPTKGIKKTKTGFSTAASELEKLQDTHPLIPLIQEYREIAKLQNTYVETLPLLVQKDGRIHSSFNQTITTTGRLSSSDPNLQNIPVRAPLGQQIRKAFVSAKGKKLLSADYSQIELRLAAVLAKDESFLRAFQDGADIHVRTASEVWQIKEQDVTKEQRRAAKAINFGILYGTGYRSLARATGLSASEAKEFIDRYFHIHHGLKEYIDQTKRFVHEHGYVQTLFGRRRYLPQIHSGVQMLVSQAERMAVNMPMQGTQADIIKMAMIEIDAWIRTLKSGAQNNMSEKIQLLLQVHDELVFEVEQQYVDTAVESIRHLMESVVQLDIPLAVDVEVGDSWGEMHVWKKDI